MESLESRIFSSKRVFNPESMISLYFFNVFSKSIFDALDNFIDNPIGRGGQAESYSRFASGLVVLKAKEEDIRPGLEKAADPFYFMATDLWK
jgi:hypothetical protein